MPTRAKVEKATFTGVKNGRPQFDFGNHTAPPDWLLKLASEGRVVNDEFIAHGRALKRGETVMRYSA